MATLCCLGFPAEELTDSVAAAAPVSGQILVRNATCHAPWRVNDVLV
jgi:hypothetical protein